MRKEVLTSPALKKNKGPQVLINPRDTGLVFRPKEYNGDPLKIYLKEISRNPLLKPEEEINLFKKYNRGIEAQSELLGNIENSKPVKRLQIQLNRQVKEGEEAFEKLVVSNLRLVVSIAKRYLGRGVPLSDLIQEGNIGLKRAVEKYDHKKGFKLSTYASWWIRQAISRFVNEDSKVIHIPSHMFENIARLTEAENRMAQELGRMPTQKEIQDRLCLTDDQYRRTQSAMADLISLESPTHNDGEKRVADIVGARESSAPDSVQDRMINAEALALLKKVLTKRQYFIFVSRNGLLTGEKKTLAEIGTKLGRSRERIRQIETKALATLQDPANAERFKKIFDIK